MAILLLYGDESQLIDEKKRVILTKYKDLAVQSLNDEVGPGRICEKLSEDSLFGEPTLYCLINPPIFVKPNKKVSDEWQQLYNLLITYEGANPVLILYHDTIDKRTKHNSEFLKKITNVACMRLKKEEIVQWLQSYCKQNGFTITMDGLEYMKHLLELWQDVPVSFLRTEFDRYFLLLPPKGKINAGFFNFIMVVIMEQKIIFLFQRGITAKRMQLLYWLCFLLCFRTKNRNEPCHILKANCVCS